jgi:hypothetical protein
MRIKWEKILIFPVIFLLYTNARGELGTLTGLILLPTAYSAYPERYLGLNSTFLFHYYIGDIYYTEENSSPRFVNPLNYLILSSDIKWNFIKEGNLLPSLGIASGVYANLVGKPAAKEGATIEVKSGNLFFLHFIILSKKLIKDKIGIHLGASYGKIANLINPLLLNPWEKENVITPFVGVAFKAFSQREIKLEYIVWKKKSTYLINLFIPGLFGFNLSWLKSPYKYSLLGYFSYRINLFP